MFKILIIDANTPFRKSLKEVLIRRFAAVAIREAASAAEGLAKVDAFGPQLIFIDIYLPDKNGLDLANKIRMSHPEIIISLFASFDSPEYRAVAAKCGVKHLIPKDDWTGDDILELVRDVLDKTG